MRAHVRGFFPTIVTLCEELLNVQVRDLERRIVDLEKVAKRLVQDDLSTADVWGGGNVTNHDSRAMYAHDLHAPFTSAHS